MTITSQPDHVAVAVPSIEEAAVRWRDGLGGAWCSPKHGEAGGFATQQLRFNGGAKLELLEPTDPTGFAATFLERFGSRIHHVTLKVPDVLAATDEVRAAGYDVVDVNTEHEDWHEAFLRPSQVGGFIVQLAWSPLTVEQWAAQLGSVPEPEPTTGPVLLGPTFYHPDLDASQRVWETLGATVTAGADYLEISWPDAPLTVGVVRGDPGSPPVLRFSGVEGHGADPAFGPATVAALDG